MMKILKKNTNAVLQQQKIFNSLEEKNCKLVQE